MGYWSRAHNEEDKFCRGNIANHKKTSFFAFVSQRLHFSYFCDLMLVRYFSERGVYVHILSRT